MRDTNNKAHKNQYQHQTANFTRFAKISNNLTYHYCLLAPTLPTVTDGNTVVILNELFITI